MRNCFNCFQIKEMGEIWLFKLKDRIPFYFKWNVKKINNAYNVLKIILMKIIESVWI